MDRLEFTSGINYSVSNELKPITICKHFDEIMCLYDVMEQIESSIDANIEDDHISFNIQTNSIEDAKVITNRIQNITICKFNSRYVVDGSVRGTTLAISINKIHVPGF